jgi:hypothetical protein
MNAVALVALTLLRLGQSDQSGVEITRSVVACGGGIATAVAQDRCDRGIALGSTIGQPAASIVHTNEYTLISGFWGALDLPSPPSLATCGDGRCECGETQSTCCTDCGCPTCQHCVDSSCQSQTRCGDGICDSGCGETRSACPQDCGCSGGSTDATVVIGDCDSGVENKTIPESCGDGGTMHDAICRCIEDAINHGKCVSCVAHLVKQWRDCGLISGRQGGKIKSCAGRGCPHPSHPPEPECVPTDPPDGFCDVCDGPEGSDCAPLPPGCNDVILGDGCCDPECVDDEGDCATDPAVWCDPACVNSDCSYRRFHDCLGGPQASFEKTPPPNCVRWFDLKDFASFQGSYNGR